MIPLAAKAGLLLGGGLVVAVGLLGARRAGAASVYQAPGRTLPGWMGGSELPDVNEAVQAAASSGGASSFPGWMGGGGFPDVGGAVQAAVNDAVAAAPGGGTLPDWMGGFAVPDVNAEVQAAGGSYDTPGPEDLWTRTQWEDSWSQAPGGEPVSPGFEPAPVVQPGAPVAPGGGMTLPGWAGGFTVEVPQVPSGGSPAPYDPRGDANLQWYQWALSLLGYDPGPLDGRMGQQTRHALQKFQTAHRLRVSGTLDDATMTAINRAVEAQQPGVNPAADW